MKKTLLSALVAVLGFTTQATAQSSILATLHHNGEIKTFYGTNALSEANKVAADGDVITLSSGTFNAPADTITKAITLRGAGMELDTLNNVEPTIINGNIVLNIPETATSNFIIEAVDLSDTIRYIGTLKSPQFIKSRMDYFTGRTNSRIINAQFLHCIISHRIYLCENSSATLVNCYVRDPYCQDKSTSNFEFQNCVMYLRSYNLASSIIRNSIIVYCDGGGNASKNEYYALAPSVTAYNCVGIWTGELGYTSTSKTYLFYFQTNTSNTELEKATAYNTIFKDWNFYYEYYKDGRYYMGESLQNFKETRLELAESFKTTYKGSDGTEVGIYGGKLPFDAVSTNPRITKCEVDGKTTADGKLSVKVEVNGKN